MMAALPSSVWIRMCAVSRDTHPAFSGCSTAIPEMGHPSHWHRPAQTWPGSALAERNQDRAGGRAEKETYPQSQPVPGNGAAAVSPPITSPALQQTRRAWCTVAGEVLVRVTKVRPPRVPA